MVEIIENPWHHLPKVAPFVLPQDKEIVGKYNDRCTQQNYKLRTDVMPVPFIGDVLKSKIVILMSNPKFVEEWPNMEDDIVREKYRKVFTHTSDFPFFCLDPTLKVGENWGLGGKYWDQRLKKLANTYYDKSLEHASNDISIIQLNPYSSKEFKNVEPQSQSYNFHLVREAIKRKAIIIIARGERIWLEKVGQLKEYPYLKLKNYRSAYITENNLIDKDNQPVSFEKLGL